jgi:hypothetical protein
MQVGGVDGHIADALKKGGIRSPCRLDGLFPPAFPGRSNTRRACVRPPEMAYAQGEIAPSVFRLACRLLRASDRRGKALGFLRWDASAFMSEAGRGGMARRIRGMVGGGAAAVATALFFVNAGGGGRVPPDAGSDVRPATGHPQRARLVRLDKNERQERRETETASRLAMGNPLLAQSSAPPLRWERSDGGGMAANVLALLAVLCVALWLAGRRRLAFETG